MIDTAEVTRLSVEDRLELVELIWDSIAIETSELPVPAAQLEELPKRLDRFEADPARTSSWKDVRRRVESQL